MYLSEESITALANILTGQNGLTEPANKKLIDEVFELIGSKHLISTYSDAFQEYPDIKNSRMISNKDFKLFSYTKVKLHEINRTSKIHELVKHYLLSFSVYFQSDMSEEIISYLNTYFESDNYCIVPIELDSEYRLYSVDKSIIDYDCLFQESEKGAYVLIDEQVQKCIKKIKEQDYSGAITNSRSLLEQILREIQIDINPDSRRGYNGKLGKLLEKVLKDLDITEGLAGKPKKGYDNITEGFQSITEGISLLRHGMSDAHNISHPPNKKDALLAVNTAKTLANFIVEHYFEKFVNAT